LFDISVYNNDKSTRDFYHMIEELYNKSLRVVLTFFHFFLKRLAVSDQLVRHYTQNIDCIKNNLSYLKFYDASTSSKKQRFKTIQLHERLRTMICQKCRLKNFFAPELFHEMSVLICPRCDEIKTRRVVKSKRSRGIERLRFRIVLYKEVNSNENLIEETIEKDLQKPIDTVLIIGTTMKVPGIKRLMIEFSRVAKARSTSTVI
jgi:NAD-dependent histone deacetylase SIR2